MESAAYIELRALIKTIDERKETLHSQADLLASEKHYSQASEFHNQALAWGMFRNVVLEMDTVDLSPPLKHKSEVIANEMD